MPDSPAALGRPLPCLLALAALAAPAGAESITGLCPDGSLFIVQRVESIPCSEAKRVEPHEVPPLRPELLPRPYTWQVYKEGADPNNPYNLIDAARSVRALTEGSGGADGAGATPGGASGASTPTAGIPAPWPEAAAGPGADPLGLGAEEIRDLFLIVELSQEQAPASFEKQTVDGKDAFTLSFARSPAFETHLRDRSDGGALGPGPVLLFSAVADRAEPFHANLTFTQGHLAFSPEPGDARQLGILQGRLGDLDAGEVVIGWVALPETMDPRRPVDVYWNDRHLEATFGP